MSDVVMISVLAAAAACDLKTGRIPNLLILFGALTLLFLRIGGGGPPGAVSMAEGAVLPAVLCAPLFVFSMLGAGDIKLLMLAGLCRGFPRILSVLVCSCAAGAVIALTRIFIYRMGAARKMYFLHYIQKVIRLGKPVPYISEAEKKSRAQWLFPFSTAILAGFIMDILISEVR